MKICGITSVGDALIAQEAGADMIGVIAFSQSPRCISPDKIREIFDAVPSLTRCCVSHGPSTREMAAICDLVPDVIQVPSFVQIPDSCTARVFRSIRPGDPLPDDANALIIDASHGSGRNFDAAYAVSVRRSAQVPVFLAGGLTPDNVSEAIRTVHPDGVDVATGVEYAPGKKDREKVRAFVERAKGVKV
ncbi:MAG: phosphoribosylanthranilate isomerase [Methanoregulaceae archaeon]|nr:phosphoribosylanthranilate isomerase [Methanoregulaceae archaeon]